MKGHVDEARRSGRIAWIWISALMHRLSSKVTGRSCMEVNSSDYEAARDHLARFAELEKSPEYIHTYRIRFLYGTPQPLDLTPKASSPAYSDLPNTRSLTTSCSRSATPSVAMAGYD